MKTNRILYILSLCLALGAFPQPVEAQNNAGESVKKFGRRFRDAIADTYHDAVSAIKGEPAADRSSRGSDRTARTTGIPSGEVYYVSIADGSNRAEGTKEAPFKNIQKALDVAPEGSVILVSEGNYFGTLRSGNINIEKPVTILGGYNADFTERDVLKYRTTVCPSVESNETQSGKGTMQIRVRRAGTKVIVDGLLFDRGHSIAYDPTGEGKPDGVGSPRMQTLGEVGKGGEKLDQETKTAQTAILFLDNCQSEVEIRNCSFVNAPDCAIKGTAGAGVIIENNVFACIRKAAVEISGSMIARNSDIRFSNNTVLFVWPSDPEEGDLGFAYRFMNGANSYLDHNILGCCTLAALDRCRVETIKEKETLKVTSAEYNLFFQNPLGDIALPGGDRPLLVQVKEFEDVEQLTGVRGNRDTEDPAIFEGALDEAYLAGFQTSETMYMNRYDFEKALALFGAVEEYGAQAIRPEEVTAPARREGRKSR
ncbi:MAG: DUF1565 domain-containing protein [Bacteroidales bacterium]|nr:DUF1565 domain-containing protein [Bacteroidales bacterium]